MPEVTLPLRTTPLLVGGTILASEQGELAGLPCRAVLTHGGVTLCLSVTGGTRHLALDFGDLLAAVRDLLGREEAARLDRLGQGSVGR